jgi:hypothetical protein
MTLFAPDVARLSERALSAWLRRRLPRRRVAPISGAWRSESGVHPADAGHLLTHVQTTERLASCLSRHLDAR